MAPRRRRRRLPRRTARRRSRGSQLGTLLLAAVLVVGLGYAAKTQGWIRVGPGGRITVPAITPAKPPATTIVQAAPRVPAGRCDPTLQQHVWRPQRLKVLAACMTVTGVIDLIRLPELDGDEHINIRLDAPYQRLIHRPGVPPGSSNDYANMRFQHGDLVTEAVCQHRALQPDAVSACAGFHGSIQIPPIGTRIRVTGVYVFDAEHGWTELHPISSITRIV
jgi:hypothetical protein